MRAGGTVGGAYGPDAVARQYAWTRDPGARDALVALCEPLVRGVASDYQTRGLDDDLVQEGYLGLLRAIDHYDPSRGTPFLVFARHFVRGGIGHFLRDHRWVMRRPRWMDRTSEQIDRAVGECLSSRGRYPGLARLADSLGLDEDSLAEILKTGLAVRTLPLDAGADGQATIEGARSRGLRSLASTLEDHVVVVDALATLSPLQHTVVFHVFFADLTQVETAARMGISQKHVSRVLAGALLRLRRLLGDYPSGE